MKNKQSFRLCLLAAFLFAACEKAGDNPEAPFLTVLPDAVEFQEEGGSIDITVETNQRTWNAVSNESWCLVEQAGAAFRISAVANDDPVDRLAEVVVTAGTLTKEIPVRQRAAVVPGPPVVDLSDHGTSNCYIVSHAGRYSFDATVIGNGAAGIIDPDRFHTDHPSIAPVSAKLLWQDYYAPDGRALITSAALSDGGDRVEFTTADPLIPGNALIAVYDGDDRILWSWHIWMPSVAVTSFVSATGYEVMNLNIGALTGDTANPKSYGMLYQWGRKDPFPAAATLLGTTATLGTPLYDDAGRQVEISHSNRTDLTHNNLTYAVRNPTVCLSNYAQYTASRDWLRADLRSDALWGNPQGGRKDANNQYVHKGVKSCYDPCPPGWRVPPVDVFRTFTPSGGYEWADDRDVVSFDVVDRNGDGALSLADYSYGWQFYLHKAANTFSYFPAAARYDGQYAMLMGSMSGLWGAYWGNAPYESATEGMGFSVLSFQIRAYGGAKEITASPTAGGARADAYSVRCIKE
ncbi:MAG: BACON domain-containing protein [Prevotellaceae bacterium]|jgi:hypothetical protein|nr:BACON domain-containing protein [Prevotellaceae bacterium]